MKALRHLFSLLFLAASDCDGMCNHCAGKLKELCIIQKEESK